MPPDKELPVEANEFFYTDASGTKRDAELHRSILAPVDYPIIEEIMAPIRARHRAKYEKERKQKQLKFGNTDLFRFNPHHAPAGSPEGGQFTSGGDGAESGDGKAAFEITKRPGNFTRKFLADVNRAVNDSKVVELANRVGLQEVVLYLNGEQLAEDMPGGKMDYPRNWFAGTLGIAFKDKDVIGLNNEGFVHPEARNFDVTHIVTHELMHKFDTKNNVSTDEDFRVALKSDVKQIKGENNKYKYGHFFSSREAWAEISALQHGQPSTKWGKDVKKMFPRAWDEVARLRVKHGLR